MIMMKNMASFLNFKSTEISEKFAPRENYNSKDNFQKVLDRSLMDKNLNALDRRQNKTDKIPTQTDKNQSKINKNTNDKISEVKDDNLKSENVRDTQESKTPSLIKLDGKEVSTQELSSEDKKLIEDLSKKLGISEEDLIKLLSVLNIDLDSLKQFDSVEIAVESIKETFNTYLNEQGVKTDIADISDSDYNLKINDGNIKMVDNNASDKSGFGAIQTIINQSEVSEQPDNSESLIRTGDLTSKDTGVQTKSSEEQHNNINHQSQKPLTNVVSQNISSNADLSENSNNTESDITANTTTQKNEVSEENPKTELPDFLSNLKVINQKSTEKQTDLNFDSQIIDQTHKLNTHFARMNTVKSSIMQNTVQKDNIFDQIVNNAKLVLSETQSEMHLELKPESLGKLSLKIATENGIIAAKITAESEKIKAIIESNLNQLKDSLQKQGLNIQDLSVTVGQDSNNASKFMSNKQKAKNISINNVNTVNVSESYVDKQSVVNPYTKSDSNVDFVA